MTARFLVVLMLSLGLVTAMAQADTITSPAGDVTVHPVSHGTLVLTWEGRTIYVDPVGEAEAFGDHPSPDLILITDIHGDHLSAETVAAVAGEATTIVAPAAVAEKLGDAGQGRAVVLANGETSDPAGIRVEAIPMYNLTEGRESYHPKGRGNGYVVTLGDQRIYLSGDTEDIPEMRALEAIDAAFLCMNLPYTMEVEKAADAALELQPRIVYPYHYRGKDGYYDVERFKEIVSKNEAIEVRLLDWYPE